VNWKKEFRFWDDLSIKGPKWKMELRFWFWFVFIIIYLIFMVICGIAAHEAMNLGL